ncbi:hypothetical protein [Streptomyces sp. NPDC058739]|uniref:hypothetical protein n=1 Tax=Streptomyces sp. NPDC058739 TaxID=3346618 RepID=UPI0036AA595C
MWPMLEEIVRTVWHWLPEATIALKFCAALMACIVTAPLLVRRIRRWLRRS